MNLSNFNIASDFIAIESNGVYYDLHNNFEFTGLSYDVLNRKVKLSWVKSTGDWVAVNFPNTLDLNFSGVSLFKCKERDSGVPYTEDDCLGSLGFIHNDMVNEIEGFVSIEPSDDACHLNLSFESGFALKIAADSAKCSIS
ncbi:MAG: hypothetical protein KBT77_02990 [Thalassolituus oleivorans]|uniref:hypothetical protein n=1 Tax=Thalassolituus oleivorans TaxID=187493 RepID=UPI001B67E830|nr:hypothetical protein [Thalassolituus oleivorans]MBQ0726300.1 hypothetical protein [Thalassolituus oleivorans]